MQPVKVKNHATVPRGPVLSAGRGDYISAGTQVLLNTLPPLPPSILPLPLSLFSFAQMPPGPVQVQIPLCCNTPSTCLCLSLTTCKTKERKCALSVRTNCTRRCRSAVKCPCRLPTSRFLFTKEQKTDTLEAAMCVLIILEVCMNTITTK